MVFFSVFFRTLGFLCALLIFFIIISFLLQLTNNLNEIKFSKIDGDQKSKNIIATINLNGPIINNNNTLGNNLYNYINPADVKFYLEELKKIKVKILIININSPGGTVSATNELENIFYKFKRETNVKIYFFTKEILASGGYWIATSADKIFASYGSIIGSIGVNGPSWFYYDTPISLSSGIFGQTIETENGIKVYDQNAGQGKDLFNPYRRPENREIKHLQNIVDEIYDDFLIKVSKSRKIDISFIENNIGALIYSSLQARENYLIDDILDYEDLIKYIIKENNFNDYLIYEKKINNSFFGNLFANYNNKNYSYDNICKKFKTNINVVMPSFLEEC